MKKYLLLLLINFINISETFVKIPLRHNITLLKNKFMCTALSLSNNTNTQSYLDQINTKKDSNIRRDTLSNIPKENPIKKLENVKNNIDKYMKMQNKTIEKGFKSTYRPIPKVLFDTIFLNIFQIHTVYISSNKDRFIFELNNTNRYVYYIKDNDDYNKMEKLLNIIPNKIKIMIINDIEKTMDDPFGYLYCDPK